MFGAYNNPNANLGFGGRFQLGRAYSPSLQNIDMTPGMIRLGPAPGDLPPIRAQLPAPAVQAPSGQLPTVPHVGVIAPGEAKAQMPMAHRGGLSQDQLGMLAQLGGLLNQRQQPQGLAPQAMPLPTPGVTPANDSLSRLLAMYGIRGGIMA